MPVGDDQKQHLELTRDIAQEVQHRFRAADEGARASTTTSSSRITEPLITGPATRVMSLRDGKKKMSKSDPSDKSRIG